MDKSSIEYLLLGMQRALLGEVTPALRGVFVNLKYEPEEFHVYFYYEGEVSEERRELWECVITEASAVLGKIFYIYSEFTQIDPPTALPVKGCCAYLRKEESGASCLSKATLQPKIQKPTIGYAMLAVQYALLGVVTPELRSVVVDVAPDPLQLYLHFYHDGEISENVSACWKTAQEAAQVYFGFDCLLDAAIERVDYPQKMPFRGRYAYLRDE